MTKARVARAAGISRMQLDRVLDPTYTGVTLKMLNRVAFALGQRLSVRFESA